MSASRLDRLRVRLHEVGGDALLLTHLPDVRWACGFTGSNGLLLVHREGAEFVTDSRYATQAAAEVADATVHVPGYDLVGHLAGLPGLAPDAVVYVQGSHVTLDRLAELERARGDVRWTSGAVWIRELVARKAEDEIERLRRAQRLTEAVFDEVVPLIAPGVTEQEIAAEIVYRHLRKGAERMAFDPIVAAGPNGALPHARAGSRPLQRGDLLVIDVGGVLDGYASDMTRTVAVGEPGDEARRVYGVVLEAQQRALDAARAGMAASALDAAARDVIAEAGYGDYFGHSLGHGIGLQTHEWPSVSFRNDAPLPERAVVTIEPGVYLPGRLGVRIEDMVVLYADGAENLTATPKDLLIL